jgi:hypothetical protein
VRRGEEGVRERERERERERVREGIKRDEGRGSVEREHFMCSHLD